MDIVTAVISPLVTLTIGALLAHFLGRKLESLKVSQTEGIERLKSDLGLGLFRSQRWWEEKHKAYASIIDDLVDLQFFFSVSADAEMEGRTLSEAFHADQVAKTSEAKQRLRRTTLRGSYIISAQAVDAIGDLLHRFEDGQYHTWWEELDASYGHTSECLKVLRAEVDRELAPPGSRA